MQRRRAMYKKFCLGICIFMAISMTIQPITLAQKAPKREQSLLDTIYEEQDIRWFREGDKDPCKKAGSTGDISGNSNQEKIWNFLTGSGLSAEQAAGVMGNSREIGRASCRERV